MKRKDYIEVIGIITEALPNSVFNVLLIGGNSIKAHPSAKLRRNFIRVSPGDNVVVLVPSDFSEPGRITEKRT